MRHPITLGFHIALIGILSLGCARNGEPVGPKVPSGEVRVEYNPYAHVDWSTTQRFLAQTHDHTANNSRILAYQSAGYDVIPYGDYSGDPEQPFSWTELHWPPENWLPPSTVAALSSDLLYPGVEVIFGSHIVAMFLDTYIEHWTPALGTPKQSYHFENVQEKVNLINAFGGLAIAAHPTGTPAQGVVAQEVYNALFRISFLEGTRAEDFNESYFLPVWDAALSSGRLIWGVGVNDHYGPYESPDTPEIDSGKTVVLAPSLSELEVRAAFGDGRLFGVRDLGTTKGLYPRIDSITVLGESVITIATTESVRWISMGVQVGTGSSFDVMTLSESAKYVRAEVDNADGSIVYVQPFGLKPQVSPSLQGRRKRGL